MAFNRTAGDRIPARGMAGPGVLGSGHSGVSCGISSFPGEERPRMALRDKALSVRGEDVKAG